MSSFRSPAGVDLDAIFAPRVAVTAAATNFRNTDGLDLNQRYEGLGSQTPAAPTVGYRNPSGVDLSLVFATSSGVPMNFSGSGSALNTSNTSGSAVVTITVRRDGTNGGLGSPTGGATDTQWFSVPRTDVGDSYDVFFTTTGGSGGTWGGSALSTWLQLNTNRSVTLTRSSNGTSSGTVDIQIRRRSDNVVVSTGSYTVSATRGDV